MNLSKVINELVEERDLDRSILGGIVGEGVLAAYKRKYPDLELKVEYTDGGDSAQVVVEKHIVLNVEDEYREITLRKASSINPKLKEGDTVWVPFEGTIGRIEILAAKQVIADKIRHIEAQAVYNAFKASEGSVVHGTVYKQERGGLLVKIQDTIAFLPRSLAIPGERCAVGSSIRALLKEVLPEPRSENQLILDRASVEFVSELFRLEIPEVFERIVEIKKAVRVPGYKSKIVVFSNDQNIDPVGTCVGVGGSRIKPILRELGGEKIDIIVWADSLEDMVKAALKPAAVERVEIEGASARVWLEEDQRALAIGKQGQNISLASRLVDLDIKLADRAVARRSMEGDVEEE